MVFPLWRKVKGQSVKEIQRVMAKKRLKHRKITFPPVAVRPIAAVLSTTLDPRKVRRYLKV